MNDQILSEKNYQFIWNNAFCKTEISFKIPVLDRKKCSVLGDWGPMYTFEVDANSPIEITYKDLNTSKNESFALDNEKLILESPMFVDERRELPLYYIIEHKERGLRYLLYVDDGFCLNKVRIIRTEDKVCLYEEVL